MGAQMERWDKLLLLQLLVLRHVALFVSAKVAFGFVYLRPLASTLCLHSFRELWGGAGWSGESTLVQLLTRFSAL